MSQPDLSMLRTLAVLLDEGSVVGAAQRMGLSNSAMSRALSRLRETVGDPLLVRAGRGLVATPRAMELRERVGELVREGEALLLPAGKLDLARLEREFVIRTREGFVENFGAKLVARVGKDAPRVRLRFVTKQDRESTHLREGRVDLETAVVGRKTGPEVRAKVLFRDRWVGVVRNGFAGRVSLKQYLRGRHVRAEGNQPVDAVLEAKGFQRDVGVVVDGFAGALVLARSGDWIATVPERHTGVLRAGMQTFELPLDVKPIVVSLLWHPRMDADPGHKWLRGCLLSLGSS